MGGAQIHVERFKYRNLSQVVCTLPPPIKGGAALSDGSNRLANNIGNAAFQSSMSSFGSTKRTFDLNSRRNHTGVFKDLRLILPQLFAMGLSGGFRH